MQANTRNISRMATLADSFLDDLDELGESSDEEQQDDDGQGGGGGGAAGMGLDGEGDEDMMQVRVREGRR